MPLASSHFIIANQMWIKHKRPDARHHRAVSGHGAFIPAVVVALGGQQINLYPFNGLTGSGALDIDKIAFLSQLLNTGYKPSPKYDLVHIT